MFEDIIFNKIYKNKKYLKKLFEDKTSDNLKKLNDNFDKILSLINKFSVNSFIYTSLKGNIFQLYYFYINCISTFDSYQYDTLEQLESDIRTKTSKLLLKDTLLPNDTNIDIYPLKWSHKNSRYIISMPFKLLEINIKNLRNGLDTICIYKNVQDYKKLNNDTFIQDIKSRLNISQTPMSDLINILSQTKEKLIQKIYDEEKIDQNFNLNPKDRLKDYSDEEINATSINNIKEDGVINIMSFKDEPNKIRPFIYTKQIVSDDRPRPPSIACDMLIQNTEILKQNVQNSPKNYLKLASKNEETNKIEESINNFNSNILLEKKLQKDEINSKYETKNMLLNNKNLIDEMYDTSIIICDVYTNAFELAKKKIFNENYVNSEGLNYNTHLYLVELLSPLVLVANKCTWGKLSKKEGFEALKDVTGTKGKDFWNENTYIGYYTQSNEPLADSYVFINKKKIEISTKGGANGQGAAASIVSLRNYIYEYNGNESNKKRISNFNENDWELTQLGYRVKKIFPNEFEIFNILSTVSYNNLSIKQFSKYVDISKYKSMDLIISALNTEYDFTGFIMEVLQSATFDFAQVNAKTSSFDKDFHFDFTVQYPAVFDGKVKIEKPASEAGFTKFHIL